MQCERESELGRVTARQGQLSFACVMFEKTADLLLAGSLTLSLFYLPHRIITSAVLCTTEAPFLILVRCFKNGPVSGFPLNFQSLRKFRPIREVLE